ncbi:MAG TPA: hypothetical protein VKP66_16905 [Steroidobacteraceae bacterium]|nr:hypothetical protein [Steroidobacteraceae bacterium]
MELPLETPAKLRRPFDAMHFLLTPRGLQAPRAGTLLPPPPAATAGAAKSSALA